MTLGAILFIALVVVLVALGIWKAVEILVDAAHRVRQRRVGRPAQVVDLATVRRLKADLAASRAAGWNARREQRIPVVRR